jgi:hypothetical protein
MNKGKYFLIVFSILRFLLTESVTIRRPIAQSGIRSSLKCRIVVFILRIILSVLTRLCSRRLVKNAPCRRGGSQQTGARNPLKAFPPGKAAGLVNIAFRKTGMSRFTAHPRFSSQKSSFF